MDLDTLQTTYIVLIVSTLCAWTLNSEWVQSPSSVWTMSLIHLVSLERSGTVGGRQPLVYATSIQSCYKLESHVVYRSRPICCLIVINNYLYITLWFTVLWKSLSQIWTSQSESTHAVLLSVCPVFIYFCTAKLAISTTKPGLIVNFFTWRPVRLITGSHFGLYK